MGRTRNLLQASDLQEAPTVTGDSVELRTNSLRVVAKSTRETRRLGAEIDEAYRNGPRSGKADPKAKGRKGAGSQATPAKRPMAFFPTNTLGLVSRPGFGGGGGGKRGKFMAAKAATGGAGRGMQRGVGMGVSGVGVSGMVSSGKVRRRQGSGSDSEEVEEMEEPRSRRRSDDGHEQVGTPGRSGRREGGCCADSRPFNQTRLWWFGEYSKRRSISAATCCPPDLPGRLYICMLGFGLDENVHPFCDLC